jgi:hypothetical protein
MLGELVTDIQRIDPDWWLVKNEAGQVSGEDSMDGCGILMGLQTGLVPSNYLTVVEDEDQYGAPAAPAAAEEAAEEAAPQPAAAGAHGAHATALYDYEAGEDNELSFPENAIITNVVSDSRSLRPLSLSR